MCQPPLETLRLTLRPNVALDLSELHGLWSDPEVRRFLFDDREVSLELAKSVLDDCLPYGMVGYGLWMMHLKPNREVVGCVGVVPAKTSANHEPALSGLLELLVSLAPLHWHRGYAQEAASALLTHVFDTLGESVLAAVNDVANIASERMLKKLGFKLLSEVKGARFPLRTYTLRRRDWRTTTMPPDDWKDP